MSAPGGVRTLFAALMAAAALSTAAPAHAAPASVEAGCPPSATHPVPVVLLHGTMDDATAWDVLMPELVAAGYCVYAPTYGVTATSFGMGGLAPVAASAQEVAAYIAAVLAATGADRVDIVGHSQGGAIAEYYAKNLGHADRVRSAVLLAPVTHGTTLSGAVHGAELVPGLRDALDSTALPVICAACVDLEAGSAFEAALNSGPIAQPGVGYSVLATRDDLVSTPAGPASFIDEPGVVNQYVQDLAPVSVSHQAMPGDPVVIGWTRERLRAADNG
ncbi:alpha/beta fold hydrolase [Nocardia sp. NPDC051833]|uniref:esterase/lipase family protein n=1 Tax=Nocardia sp. NPDC051833 TaxID=3155674 RepID=UPI00342A26FD